jgi:hypothetical protein
LSIRSSPRAAPQTPDRVDPAQQGGIDEKAHFETFGDYFLKIGIDHGSKECPSFADDAVGDRNPSFRAFTVPSKHSFALLERQRTADQFRQQSEGRRPRKSDGGVQLAARLVKKPI